MGRNFYWSDETQEERQEEREKHWLHIGKSSAGWLFSMHVIPSEDIESWNDWQSVLQASGKIFDDSHNVVTFEELRQIVEDRSAKHPLEFDWSTKEELIAETITYNTKYNLLQTGPKAEHFTKTVFGEGPWKYCNYDFC